MDRETINTSAKVTLGCFLLFVMAKLRLTHSTPIMPLGHSPWTPPLPINRLIESYPNDPNKRVSPWSPSRSSRNIFQGPISWHHGGWIRPGGRLPCDTSPLLPRHNHSVVSSRADVLFFFAHPHPPCSLVLAAILISTLLLSSWWLWHVDHIREKENWFPQQQTRSNLPKPVILPPQQNKRVILPQERGGEQHSEINGPRKKAAK